MSGAISGWEALSTGVMSKKVQEAAGYHINFISAILETKLNLATRIGDCHMPSA